MSRRYDVAFVLTLNVMVPPWFTLMSVANPWMVGSPAPLTSHSLGGLPASAFSHTTALDNGGEHELCAATCWALRLGSATTTARTSSAMPIHRQANSTTLGTRRCMRSS